MAFSYRETVESAFNEFLQCSAATQAGVERTTMERRSRGIFDGYATRHFIQPLAVPYVVAASVYAALREQNIPVIAAEIVRTMSDKHLTLGDHTGSLIRLYDEIRRNNPNIGKTTVRFTPSQLIEKYCDVAAIPIEVKEHALVRAQEIGSLGRTTPEAIAITVIYISGREVGRPLTQQYLADIAGISWNSIRNTLRRLEQHKHHR